MRVRVPFAFLGGLRRQVEFPLPQFAEALNKYGGISFRKPTRMGMAPATIWSISPARIRSVATTPGGFPSARRVRECRFGFRKPPTVASRCNGRRTWPIPVRGRPLDVPGNRPFFSGVDREFGVVDSDFNPLDERAPRRFYRGRVFEP
jgi:hypothetical protein